MRKSVLVGMSGGVDSAGAAVILLEKGYDVSGCILVLHDSPETERDVADAREAADRLHIPFQVLDERERFRREVETAFVGAYRSGRTPNPCVLCNRSVKLPSLLEAADAKGIYYVATGHYARVRRQTGTDTCLLLRGLDPRRDQSYMLSSLSQNQVRRLLLPVGEMDKSEVRETAERAALTVAHRPDSQDICFVPDGSYGEFLTAFDGKELTQGNFVDSEGRILAPHRGQERYTIGQRRGLGVSADRPLYVVAKSSDGSVRLGDERELYTCEVWTEDFQWISGDPLREPASVTAKTRYSQGEADATLLPLEGGRVCVRFATPQRAVTPGQTLAVYQGDVLLGGGVIAKAR